jgi:hypothetical protein
MRGCSSLVEKITLTHLTHNSSQTWEDIKSIEIFHYKKAESARLSRRDGLKLWIPEEDAEIVLKSTQNDTRRIIWRTSGLVLSFLLLQETNHFVNSVTHNTYISEAGNNTVLFPRVTCPQSGLTASPIECKVEIQFSTSEGKQGVSLPF